MADTRASYVSGVDHGAWIMGNQAAFDGLPRTTNPYPPEGDTVSGFRPYAAWDEGWLDGDESFAEDAHS
jgi:hypothetical protein